MRTHLRHVSVLALSGAASLGASGAIVSVVGQGIHHTTAPGAVLPGVLGGGLVHAFDEAQSTTYTGPVSVFGPSNGVTYDWTHPGATTVRLPNVSSHFIHSEQLGASASNVMARVRFADPVIAVIFENAFLDVSDRMLGLPSVVYPTGVGNRGFSTASGGQLDRFVMLDSWTIEFRLGAALDQARVITVPGPGGVVMLAASLVVGWRRPRR